ncbi:MAG: MltA domain-containing protein [Burkholderiaceae bacterium]|nr:MltA domain-containing protein [Burkholderiaceae bacterium]
MATPVIAQRLARGAALLMAAALVIFLAGCAHTLRRTGSTASGGRWSTPETGRALSGWSEQHPKSRWVPVDWSDLPGFDADDTADAWNAWIRNCERPSPVFAPLCSEVRQLSLATPEEQRDWLRARLQPYRVEPASGGGGSDLLTGYFEPYFEASRIQQPGFGAPLYAPPPGLTPGRPWYSRQDMAQLPAARAQLEGSEIAWLADPVDALILQIQGSGRLLITETDGSQRMARLTFAATNGQPYRSPGKWLLDQGAVRDATWPGIKAWLAANPDRLNDFLWSNPRVVFFHEQDLPPQDAQSGPPGAQGVALTAGRSIAVDPQSIPLGTPVWLTSNGPQANLARLVFAQDTGTAIVGALRADYFAGWGPQAGDLAGRLKQAEQLWVLWPKSPG